LVGFGVIEGVGFFAGSGVELPLPPDVGGFELGFFVGVGLGFCVGVGVGEDVGVGSVTVLFTVT
jgi:hypothetical protein